MARLTAQQAFFLQCCRFAPRLLVQGASGSGKTLLACEEAKRHDADGATVLFLCYNRPLADHVATRLTDEAPGVMVRTFHELCREVIEAAGLPFAVPAGAAALQTFFDETCPELFMDALPAYGRRFDVILVDEMQDFRPTWWVCVGELLSASGRGLLHLFGDPAQNLYGREAELPFREPTITLPANCRNTRAIADWIETHTGKVASAGAWCPQGEAPEVVSVADDRAEAEAIRRTLHGLVYEEKIDPGRIVILGPHALDHSGLAAHRILGPYALVDYHPGRRNVTETLAADGDPNLPPDKTPIRYSTIHKFKGLEADIVLLTGLGANSPHHGDENTLTYVGASRARHRLFVFRRAPSVKPVYGTETEPCSAAAGETGRRGR